jgi:hypothetical protein
MVRFLLLKRLLSRLLSPDLSYCGVYLKISRKAILALLPALFKAKLCFLLVASRQPFSARSAGLKFADLACFSLKDSILW